MVTYLKEWLQFRLTSLWPVSTSVLPSSARSCLSFFKARSWSLKSSCTTGEWYTKSILSEFTPKPVHSSQRVVRAWPEARARRQDLPFPALETVKIKIEADFGWKYGKEILAATKRSKREMWPFAIFIPPYVLPHPRQRLRRLWHAGPWSMR